MAKLQLIITGAGHSGTTYITHMLSRAGVNAFHESAARCQFFRPESDQVVEVSWLAAGYEIPEGILVYHLVRHPCLVANSFRGFFDPHMRQDQYQAFVRERLPDLSDEWPELDYWLDWNERTKNLDPDRTFVLEDLDVDDFLDAICEDLGIEIDESNRRAAHEAPRANVRSNAYLYGKIDSYPRLDDLVEACIEYGFDLEPYLEPPGEEDQASDDQSQAADQTAEGEPAGTEADTDTVEAGEDAAAGGEAESEVAASEPSGGESEPGDQAEPADPQQAEREEITEDNIALLGIGSKPEKPTRVDMMNWLRERQASYETDDNRASLVAKVLEVANRPAE